MKNNTILKPGDIVYVKLADTTFIGTLQHLTKKDKWQVLAYPILNTAKDKGVKEWRNMGYLKTILKVDAQYITKYDVVILYPASVTIIDTDLVTQAFCVYSQIHDGNIGIFPIFPNVPGSKAEAKAWAERVKDEYNREWRHQVEIEMIKQYFDELDKNSKSTEAE